MNGLRYRHAAVIGPLSRSTWKVPATNRLRVDKDFSTLNRVRFGFSVFWEIFTNIYNLFALYAQSFQWGIWEFIFFYFASSNLNQFQLCLFVFQVHVCEWNMPDINFNFPQRFVTYKCMVCRSWMNAIFWACLVKLCGYKFRIVDL